MKWMGFGTALLSLVFSAQAGAKDQADTPWRLGKTKDLFKTNRREGGKGA